MENYYYLCFALMLCIWHAVSGCWLCPLRSISANASACFSLRLLSTLNALLQATMLRIRATNRTIVGYVRCARFPQMQALASLFACGQPGYRGSHGDAVLRFFKIAINPRFGIKKGTAFAVPFLSLTYEKATPKILPLCYVFIKSARKTRSITRAYSHIISVQNIPQNK